MMILKNISKTGIVDVVRCDEPHYLIWKWRPDGMKLGESERENAIRCGSTLRVKAGEVAVFISRQEDRVIQSFIEGPFDGPLITDNIPFLTDIANIGFGGKSIFQSEVYFINLEKNIQIRFGVPFFDVYDSKFPDISVPVAVRGNLTFNITDYERFIGYHRTMNIGVDDFKKRIRDIVNKHVKEIVMEAPDANNISLLKLGTKTSVISEEIETYIRDRLGEEFAVNVTSLDITDVEFDESDLGYHKLVQAMES
mgnify:CR=1 FL=1